MLQFIVLEYSRSKDDSKDFQTIPPRQHRREAASCVLLSHLMPAPANSKTVVRPLRVEIQDPGIQDAKLERRCIHVQQRPSASRQREGSRFERGPPRRLAPPRYSPSLECNYAFGFDVVARRCCSRVMTAPRRLIGETSLRARTRTHRRDGCIIRKGRPDDGANRRLAARRCSGPECRREDRQRPDAPWMHALRLAGHVSHWFGISWNAIIVADWADLELLIRHDDDPPAIPDCSIPAFSKDKMTRRIGLPLFFSQE